MRENETLDPFKPAQPRIPGVSKPEVKLPPAGQKENHGMSDADGGLPAASDALSSGLSPGASLDRTAQLKFLWIGLTLAGALATVFFLFVLNRRHVSTNVS